MSINTLRVMFIGAVNTVTGSCSLLEYTREKTTPQYYLVDCGLYQEEKGDPESQSFLLAMAKKIRYVFLTHAHIDHIGLLPKLIENGFTGKVYCTKATHALSDIMLRDLLSIEGKNSYEISSILKSIQYNDLDAISNSIFGGKSTCPISTDLMVGFKRSSHILGSCSFFFSWKKDSEKDQWTTIHFSSDLGPVDSRNRPSFIMKNHGHPYFGENNSFFVMESTYGNRVRDKENILDKRTDELLKIINRHTKLGKVLIPAFSLNRSQEILIDLFYISREKSIVEERQHPTLEELSTKNFRFSHLSSKKYKTDTRDLITKIWIEYHEDLLQKKETDINEEKRTYLNLLKQAYSKCKNGKAKNIQDFVLNLLPTNKGEQFLPKYENLPKELACKIYDCEVQNFNPKNEIFLNYANVVAYSPLIHHINNVYIDNLLDTFMCEDESNPSMKYLSDTFFERFNIDTTNMMDSKNKAKELLQECFAPTLYKNPDPKQNKNAPNISMKKVIISSSGMCDTGSILEILPEIITDENSAIILTGYQVKNTNGYLLKKLLNNEFTDYDKYNTRLKDTSLTLAEIKCKIYDLSQYYSGHADQEQLVEYILGNEDEKYPPNSYNCKLFLTHGTPETISDLKEKIEEKNETKNIQVVLPKTNVWYNLNNNGTEEKIDSITEEEVSKKVLSVKNIDVIYPSSLSEEKINSIKTFLEKHF